jgi:4-hydroxy-tetrahydrodipicolinate reductase
VQKLGYTVTEAINGFEPVVRDHDFYCALLKRTIHAGTALGMRFLVDLKTSQGLTVKTEYDARVFEDGEVEEMRWIVNGSPGSEVRYVRKDSGIASASSLLNRVPNVLAADPGIVEITKLGPLQPFVA